MKGLLRAIFFGGGWSFGLLAAGLLVALPNSLQADPESVIIGGGSAVLSALAFWTATRLSTVPSWPVAILGWIVGLFLLPGAARAVVAIAELLFKPA